MGTRQSIGGRSSFSLYLVLILVLALAVVLVYIFLVIIPDHQQQREAETQQALATATAEARAAEVQRAYGAGVAFASAGDWEKAADEFGKVVSLDSGHSDTVARLADARNRAETTKTAATAQRTVTAMAQTLSETESAYQRGLGYLNMRRWEQAGTEFEKVIVANPTYKDVQAKMAEVATRLAESAAITPTPAPTVTPSPSPSPVPTNIVVNGDFEAPDAGSDFVTYSAGQSFGGWSVQLGSIDHIGARWQAARGKQSIDLSGDGPGTLYQDLPTVPGETYLLRFAISGNPECGSPVKSLEVWYGDIRIDELTFDTTGHNGTSMGWLYKEYKVVARSSPTRLRFRSVVQDACGPALDDVSAIGRKGQ